MKKLYTEKQYRIYVDFMKKIANEDNLRIGLLIYEEYEQWLIDNSINSMGEIQMDNRLDEELNRATNGNQCKIIEFKRN